MAEKMVRFRLFHYYVEEPLIGVAGTTGLVERHASFGDVVDIPREEDVARGEHLGAFYTDEEREAIEDGSYEGPDADLIAAVLVRGTMSMAPPGNDEGAAQFRNMSADELHDYIQENDLNEADTISLSGGNPEVAERLLDAENMAGDPRPAVVTALEGISALQAPTVTGDLGTSPGGAVHPHELGDEPQELPEDAPKRNASTDEWAEYAQLHDVEFGEDAGRDDIIKAVLDAKIAQQEEQ